MNIEPLETRIAPAGLVFTDVDGDKVTITASKPGLGAADVTIGTTPDGLHSVFSINMTAAVLNGTNLTVSVVKGKTNAGVPGDGKVIIGTIQGSINNFGTIKIAGDLGDIDVGNGSSTVSAIKALTVDSYGRFSQRGTDDAYSQINGNVGSLVVKGDFVASNFYVTGDLRSVSIGGSIRGGVNDGDGQIYAGGDLGKVTVKGDVIAGVGNYAGAIGAGHSIDSVAIGGSLKGSRGQYSGSIFAAYLGEGTLGKVTIGGSVIGGRGANTGQIGNHANSGGPHKLDVGSITIGGDLVGGGDSRAGAIVLDGIASSVGSITVKGSIFGDSGTNDYAGALEISGETGKIVVGGSLFGGGDAWAGSIKTFNADSITVGGSLIGGTGTDTGKIHDVGSIGTVTIGGDMQGGVAASSGSVVALNGLAKVIVRGSVIGGDSNEAGSITTYNAASVTIGRDLIGGAGNNSGRIYDADALGKVTIGRDIHGGSGTGSGSVSAAGDIASVIVGGSMIGGFSNQSGSIFSLKNNGRIGEVTIKGSLVGGTGNYSGSIGGDGVAAVVALGKISIGKDILGGRANGAGSVLAINSSVDSVTVKGSLVGGTSFFAGTIKATLAAGSISIGRDVVGGLGEEAGSVILGAVKTVTVGGTLMGGTDYFSSGSVLIKTGGIEVLKIGGDVRGGGFSFSGVVKTQTGIDKKIIKGALIPGIPGTGTVS